MKHFLGLRIQFSAVMSISRSATMLLHLPVKFGIFSRFGAPRRRFFTLLIFGARTVDGRLADRRQSQTQADYD